MKVLLVNAVVIMGLPSCDETVDPPITKPDIRDVAARQEEAQKDDRFFPIKITAVP
jgi:hypothetical protein